MRYKNEFGDPRFLWERPRADARRPNPQFEQYFEAIEKGFDASPSGFARSLESVLRSLWTYFGQIAFLAPLVMLPRFVCLRRIMLLLTACMATVIAHTMVWAYLPHYSGSAVGPFLLLVMLCLRRLARRGGGAAFRRTIAFALMLVMLSYSARLACLWCMQPTYLYFESARRLWFYDRQAVAEQLRQQGGKHLVLIRYRPDHNLNIEWVFNEADIDAAPVVWAREVNDAARKNLIAHFGDRQVWVLDADAIPTRPTRYSDSRPP